MSAASIGTWPEWFAMSSTRPAGTCSLAEDLGAEVLAMQERDRGERVLRPLRVEAELVDARRRRGSAGRARGAR